MMIIFLVSVTPCSQPEKCGGDDDDDDFSGGCDTMQSARKMWPRDDDYFSGECDTMQSARKVWW